MSLTLDDATQCSFFSKYDLNLKSHPHQFHKNSSSNTGIDEAEKIIHHEDQIFVEKIEEAVEEVVEEVVEEAEEVFEEVEEVVEEMVGAIKDTGSEFLHAIEEAVGAREAFFELRKNSTGRAKFEFDLEEYCNTIDLNFNIVQELTYVYNGYQFCMNPSSGGVLENIIYLDGHNDQPEPNNDSGKDDH